MSLDRLFQRAFGDDEPTHVGSGWTSGVLATVLGVLGFGAVLCLRFPSLLTAPDLRSAYPMPLVRALAQLVIGAAFLLGLVSALRRRRKTLGATGMALSLGAALLGGSKVPIEGPVSSATGLGLDWFLVNLLLLALVFVPLERAFPLDPDQLVFRPGWTTDGVHFLVSHLLVQLSTYLTLLPASVLFGWAATVPGPSGPEGPHAPLAAAFLALRAAVASQPALLQLLEVVLVADLTQYAVHRAFHRVPFLWRFHSIHHSSERLDWLAGSRLHVVDVVLTRGLTFVPVFALGFAKGPVLAYLVFVSFHAVFIHANVRFRLGVLESVLVTPRFHHWHHSAEAEAVDRNFAVHLPFLDALFGSRHMPDGRWPARYGLSEGRVPEGYVGQLVHPFR